MNAIELRNLQEQVQKNKDDILKHFQRDEVLADFGIRIIGQLETEEELNAIPTEGLEYGDAYAVGAQSPFNYYIWTRANNINPNDYWFAFGEIAIVGPQGPKGDKGATGATGQSTRWYLVSDAQWSYDATGKKPGDMVLTYPSGNVYMMGENGTFTATGNIRGPQGVAGKNGKEGPQGIPGPQGPKGDTGDVGGFINIAGIVANEYDLPDPSLIKNLTVAYLVGTAEPYTLYIQVGSNSNVAEWFDAGPLNVATMVTVNGQYQNTWDADTKLDKHTEATPSNQVYVKSYDGSQAMVDISPVPAIWQIPSYNGEGQLKTNTPMADNDCASKGYVDDSVNTRVKSYSGTSIYKGGRWLYGINGLGSTVEDFLMIVTQPDGTTQIGDKATNASIAAYNFGCLSGRDPVQPYHYATKNYVDNAISTSGPVTVPVEDQMTPWDDGGDFTIEDAFFYTIHTFATYLYQGETYTINFKPISMFTDFSSIVKAEPNCLPAPNNPASFTDEMLNGLQIHYSYNASNQGILNYWLVEPEAGYPDEVSGLSLTIILEKLY